MLALQNNILYKTERATRAASAPKAHVDTKVKDFYPNGYNKEKIKQNTKRKQSQPYTNNFTSNEEIITLIELNPRSSTKTINISTVLYSFEEYFL